MLLLCQSILFQLCRVLAMLFPHMTKVTDTGSGSAVLCCTVLKQVYVSKCMFFSPHFPLYSFIFPQSKTEPFSQGEYNVYSTFQSHEPEFDYLKSLEIEEKMSPWQMPTLMVPTLSALAVCYRDLEEPEQAFASAQRALPPVRGRWDHSVSLAQAARFVKLFTQLLHNFVQQVLVVLYIWLFC